MNKKKKKKNWIKGILKIFLTGGWRLAKGRMGLTSFDEHIYFFPKWKRFFEDKKKNWSNGF
jgi:hypothetical protein